jgi:hypothetical protein
MKLHLPQLMIILVVVTLLGATLSFTLPSVRLVPTAILLHMIFAVGIIPLIFGAMTYFVPVLTRTGAVSNCELIPPLLAFVAGLLLIVGLWKSNQLIPIAAAIDLVAVLWLSRWIQQRRGRCLGSPHPGLRWYQLALLMLLLALSAIVAGYFWPEQWRAFRHFHLHLNLLGFIGFTALSTLRVLLPTSTNISDSHTVMWLSKQWLWATPGVLLIAAGSAWYTPAAIVGLVIFAIPLLLLAKALLIKQWAGVAKLHGAAPALAIALSGFGGCLLISGWHIHGLLRGDDLTRLFILLFLLPLVTGAASHLIPLWMTATAQGQTKQYVIQTLGRFSAIRCALYYCSGLLLILDTNLYYLPAVIALFHFLYLISSGHLGKTTMPQA